MLTKIEVYCEILQPGGRCRLRCRNRPYDTCLPHDDHACVRRSFHFFFVARSVCACGAMMKATNSDVENDLTYSAADNPFQYWREQCVRPLPPARATLAALALLTHFECDDSMYVRVCMCWHVRCVFVFVCGGVCVRVCVCRRRRAHAA